MDALLKECGNLLCVVGAANLVLMDGRRFRFRDGGDAECANDVNLEDGAHFAGGTLAIGAWPRLAPDELARAVSQKDTAMIGRANGVGPKLAARIANELQGKLGVAGLTGAAPTPRAGAAADALSALANLGFKPAEASAAVNAAQDELGPDAGLDALVRLALRKAAK